MGKGTARALGKVGAYVWRRDKSLMRYRNKASAPGSPPSVHRSRRFTVRKTDRKTGTEFRQQSSPLRELTQFAFDTATKSVLVGAVAFPRAKLGPGVVPKIIEEGGTGRLLDHGKTKTGNYKARPHLAPALRDGLAQVPREFTDCIR